MTVRDGSALASHAQRDRDVQRVIAVEGTANVLVAGVKAGVGFQTGSMALLGDALHSLVDLANNVIAWVVVRWSALPPDEGHPYGHRKFETVAVFVLAGLLVVTALGLAQRALGPARPPVEQSPVGIVWMLGVLGVNLGMVAWEGYWARRLGSEILRADARHTFSDVLTTVVAIAGWQAAARGHLWVDSIAALGAAGLIAFLAIGLFKRSLPALVDQASIDPEQIHRIAAAVPGVRGVDHPRSRWVGPAATVDLVVFVDPELPTRDSHAIATAVETALRSALPIEGVTVHIEPEEEARPVDPETGAG